MFNNIDLEPRQIVAMVVICMMFISLIIYGYIVNKED